MNSGNENGALGLSGRTDAIHTSRSGAANGSARMSTVLTTENTAVVAPIVTPSVHTTVSANPNCRTHWRRAMRNSVTIHAPALGVRDDAGTNAIRSPRRQ